MLSLTHDNETGQVRLFIENPFATAWISPYRRLSIDLITGEFRHERDVPNWRLYVERSPHVPASAVKSPTQLLIESRLRAWLLQRFKRRLRDVSFEELCWIAERSIKSLKIQRG